MTRLWARRGPVRRGLLLLSLCGACACQASQQQVPQPLVELGSGIEPSIREPFTLEPGKEAVFLVGARAGEMVQLDVFSSRLEVSVFDSDNRLIGQRLCCATSSFERIRWRSVRDARYRVVLHSLLQPPLTQRVRLTARARSWKAADELRIAMERRLDQAQRRLLVWDPGRLEESLQIYDRALEDVPVHQLPDIQWAARVGISRVLREKGNHQQALEILHPQSRPALFDEHEKAEINLMKASLLAERDRPDEARRICKAVLEGHLAPTLRLSAQAHIILGDAAFVGGDLQQSEVHYRRALEDSTKWLLPVESAQAYLHLGYLQADSGLHDKAEQAFQQALRHYQAMQAPSSVARCRMALGMLAAKAGEFQLALDHCEAARDIYKEAALMPAQPALLNSFGTIYMELGEFDSAGIYFKRAYQAYTEQGSLHGKGSTLLQIGFIQLAAGRHQKALSAFEKAASIFKELEDERMLSYAMSYKGEVLHSVGKDAEALGLLSQSLQIKQRYGDDFDLARTLGRMGAIELEKADYLKAGRLLEQSLKHARKAGDSLGEALGLARQAMSARRLGDLSEAREGMIQALATLETTRSQVAGPRLRSTHQAQVRFLYDEYIDLLIQIHRDRNDPSALAEAFEASERARARSLLESLSRESPSGLTAGQPLRQRADELRRTINQSALRLESVDSTQERQRLIKEISQLRIDRREVRNRLYRKREAYAALGDFKPKSLRDIRDGLLDQDTLLLEFHLGEAFGYLFAVSATDLAIHKLPGREEIDFQVRSLRRGIQEIESQRQARGPPSRTAGIHELKGILLGSILDRFPQKRILIVADSATWGLPFALLPLGASEDPAQGQPLAASRELAMLPSASVGVVLASRQRPSTGTPTSILVIADPVFSPSDDRLALTPSSPVQQPSRPRLERSMHDFGWTPDSIPRLFNTDLEARVIGQLAGTRLVRTMRAAQADRDLLLRTRLDRYGILHFATHGILNDRFPELSGLLLSMVNSQGDPQNGFLRIHDIETLRLEARLVVLSACQTALGREIRGEGLQSMVRSFFQVGAQAVVATLWKVDDERSARFMQKFYEHLLGRERLSTAEALRRAQMDLRDQGHAARHWAGFVLHGQWKEGF